VAALRATGLQLPLSAFETGIAKADWPARLQLLSHGNLKAFAPLESELWLDGGHNADGARAVAAALGDLEERVPRPLVLVVGMLATKDCAGFLRNFAGLARRVIAVPIPRQDKSLPAETVVDVARQVGIPAESRDSIEAALAAAGRLVLELPPRILITGSLYLAGEVLARNGTPPE
jgi:dihydrofolate synthase/folylpolyglutamate synthase